MKTAQMSAWYVLSSMGIYQVTPGSAVLAKFPISIVSKLILKIKLQNNF
jgi:putative alpha-1,2-mannosidase